MRSRKHGFKDKDSQKGAIDRRSKDSAFCCINCEDKGGQYLEYVNENITRLALTFNTKSITVFR